MGLMQDDLKQIQTIVREEVREIVRDEVTKSTNTITGRIDTLEDKVEALEADIKELYFMITKLELRSKLGSEEFHKQSLREQTLQLNEMLLSIAKKQNLELPR